VAQQLGRPPLDWPHYGITPADAVARFFRKYATFSGRASRGEYWWLVAFDVALYVAFAVVSGTAGGVDLAVRDALSPTSNRDESLLMTAYVDLFRLYCIGIVVPTVALTVRRLHDTGRSGWFALLGLVPVAGAVFLLVLALGDTKPEAERYGPPGESRPPGDQWSERVYS
jgi:uncharacterized membrane protein YhaH (DUF805 family)